MHFRHDDPRVEPPCNHIHTLDASFAWVWMGWQMATTHDGGRTWHTWQPSDTWPNWTRCNYGLIRSVEYTDRATGTMQLKPLRPPEAPVLHTSDGGITWR